MSADEITAALAARGVDFDPWDISFLDGKRPLEYDEVRAILPDATDYEIATWAENTAVELRGQWAQQTD